MADRRQILKAGLIAATPGVVDLASALQAKAEPLRIHRAIYDDRYAGGRAFAAEAQARGWPVRAIRGDVTDVWYNDLAPRWSEGPAPIAGVTTGSALFVLERLAWDAGMRVASRAESPDEGLVSWLIAPARRERA